MPHVQGKTSNTTGLSRSVKRTLGYFVALLILGYFCYHLVGRWETVAPMLKGCDGFALSIHLLLLVTMNIFFVVGWHVVLAQSGSPISFRQAAFSWLVANAGKYVPGKVLMLAGRVELCSRGGVRRGACLSALVYEHALVQLAALPFLCVAFLKGAGVSSPVFRAGIVFVFAVCVGIVAKPAVLERVLNACLRLIKRPEVVFAPPMRATLGLAAFYAANWFLYGVSAIFLMRALGLQERVPSIDAVWMFVAAWQIGFLSLLTPGGLGVREGVIVLFLSSYISPVQAMAVSILARFSWTGVEMAGVVAGMLLGRRAEPAHRAGSNHAESQD